MSGAVESGERTADEVCRRLEGKPPMFVSNLSRPTRQSSASFWTIAATVAILAVLMWMAFSKFAHLQ